jgi:hypothetical protein
VLAEVHQAHVASRAKFGDGLKRNLAASCAYVLDAGRRVGRRDTLLERGKLLALGEAEKTSEVPMCGFPDESAVVNGRLVAMREKLLSGIIIGELVVAHAALVGEEGELWVALLAVVADATRSFGVLVVRYSSGRLFVCQCRSS